VVLAKANRLTLHLTGGQRRITGISYRLGEIKARINQVNQSSLVLLTGSLEKIEPIPEALYEFQPENHGNGQVRRELKEKTLSVLGLIDRIKKQILQLDILELRCRELIASIKKALKAFHHEFCIIRRKIYPFGIFSSLRRIIGSLFGRDYFSSRDLNEISALGRMSSYVLKIADSPVI